MEAYLIRLQRPTTNVNTKQESPMLAWSSLILVFFDYVVDLARRISQYCNMYSIFYFINKYINKFRILKLLSLI
jgi:hypothetical protein